MAASGAPSQDEETLERPKGRSRDLKSAMRQVVEKSSDKLGFGKDSENLNKVLSVMRRNKRESAKGGAPVPPAAPGEPTKEDRESVEEAEEPDEGGPGLAHGEDDSAVDSLAKMKRFFENLRACEEMDLSQQKALRNDQAFLESLCEEGSADTLKQKYESWQRANSVPSQEAQPAK